MLLFRDIDEAYDAMKQALNEVGKMLEYEGENDGKRRYFEIVAELLLSVDFSLGVIRRLLVILIGLFFGNILGRLL